MSDALPGTVEPSVLEFSSNGVVLIYGSDGIAIEAGRLLEPYLDVSVLLHADSAQWPLDALAFPVARGVIRSANGHFGEFGLLIDRYAAPIASADGLIALEKPYDGAVSRCDIILDLNGGTALFPAPDLRDGYLRADPRHRDSWLAAVAAARELVGTFEKPRYITFTDSRCAHSRSHITGCTRCLEVCPAGAIAPAGNQVLIDPYLCAGCGQCAAVCPTDAAAYTLPTTDALIRDLRTRILALESNASPPVVLVHDIAHGAPIIGMLPGAPALPQNVVMLPVNEVTQVGFEVLIAAFLYGAAAVRLLVRARPRHDVSGLEANVALVEALLSGLGLTGVRVATLRTDDPEELLSALQGIPDLPVVPASSFLPLGGDKASLRRQLLRQLQRVGPTVAEVVALPKGAPFGSVEVDVDGCTLCLSCVSVCPTSALQDHQDQPMLRFTEDACIQCGLCQSTCPEKVISLKPQMDFRPSSAAARVLKSEQPFCCIRCAKPFGVRSIIERVSAKLAQQHWMFKNSSQRLELIKMCDECRVAAVTEQDLDPYGPPRSGPRTTDDYLRERTASLKLKEDP
jgi:ferredoxin